MKRGLTSTTEFARAPYTVKIGDDKSPWKISIYGFAEFDVMNDSTRSYSDVAQSNVIARDETLAGQKGRTQFTARNSRFGFKMESPAYAGITALAVIEGDFMGNQPPGVSEYAFFVNGTFRLRHAYVKLLSDVVDVTAGESYVLFAQQPFFFPCSVQFLPVPNQVLHRSTQFRLSHTFKTDPVNIDVGVAAVRPIQRDSSLPEGQAALRLQINDWKALHTPGSLGTTADGAAIGVSGLVRGFKVDEFSAQPKGTQTETGMGFSVDALVPIIPVPNPDTRANALTVTGSFVVGRAIGDLFGMQSGITNPPLPNPTNAPNPPAFPSNVDNGMVIYDASGHLHTIDWRAFVVGLQYYLPPSGRVFVAANYSQGESPNVAQILDRSLATRVYKRQRYFDANLFVDITPAARVAISYQLTTQTFVDDATARNHRYMLGIYYLF
ncbi:hypothetical protein [Pendulispora albinea]|uniref:Porin n=1 Tax=Pendulispora albinea TaxID=2741071 RepID=A0ABZ2M8W4_9BACT